VRRVLTLAVLCTALFAQDAAIRMDGGVFRITGWTPATEPHAGWSSIFAIYAGEGDVPPLVGTYAVEGGSLAFRPRFPIAPGMHVRAVFHAPGGRDVAAAFDLPKAAPLASTTRVAHVYPSTDLLPENELKFYIYFSAPVQKGEAWTRIHLLNQQGQPVELPFLEIDQELWDRDNMRLTVLFDPGRIKRGLLPLKEMGPAIEEGRSYTLVIDREWPDGRGAPLAEPFRKPFRVGPPDRTPIDPAKWRIAPPRAGTREALTIVFGEPLDYALLQHSIRIDGVTGKAEVARGETEWRFTPEQPWSGRDYQVTIDTSLEDLAGNRVGRAFDVDVFTSVTRSVERETVSLRFRPAAGGPLY
jgi:hypothetical protein